MDGVDGLLVRAHHDLCRGRPDRALEALDAVRGSELGSYEYWVLRARAFYGVRRWDEAIGSAEIGLGGCPDDVGLLDVLALAQLEGGKRKEAQATIEKALALWPDSAVLHAHRGLILMRTELKSFWHLATFKQARAEIGEALRWIRTARRRCAYALRSPPRPGTGEPATTPRNC
jgi:tetratricopeptide (TPR) repeat protein